MRLGGPCNSKDSPESWVAELKRLGYRAAIFPFKHDADRETSHAFAKAAEEADILLAEVGAWSNPMSPDDNERKQAISFCQEQLALADEIGARCCVNIAGSRGHRWDGPHPENLSQDTFALIVETTQQIIDAVKPKRSFYCLESMPWVFPDSPESYLDLLKAIDRPACSVHFDPVNMISSPQRYFRNADFLRECFRLLGPQIKSCHAKDIKLQKELTVHLDEVRPGQGFLDYEVFLNELNKLDPDTPLIIEHLPNDEEYRLAAEHIRDVAKRLTIPGV